MKLRKSLVKPEYIELFGSFTRDRHALLFSERPPIYASSCMTISGERTEQLDIFCHIIGFTSNFRPPQCPQIYASGMRISGERTEQHIVIGFGELAAVD